MKILLDENLDHRLHTRLGQHEVFTTAFMGWAGLKNGKLLETAEAFGFQILLTGDRTLYDEQNLTDRTLAVIAMSSVEWRIVKDHMSRSSLPLTLRLPAPFKPWTAERSAAGPSHTSRAWMNHLTDNGVPMSTNRPPLPPFNRETAIQKVRLAEDAWNTRDPVRVSLAYTEASVWRNRSEFFTGREAIVAFLTRKWAKENGYRLIKELWAFTDNHIAVRFQYEWHDESGQWFRAYGNEQWEFSETGHMRRREASINDVPIAESERRFHWPHGPRPADHPGLSELGM